MNRRRARRGDERGAALVEAALVLPLFFLFLFALVDFGLWAFQNTQAAAAARDGARVGILRPTGTAAIQAAARSRLAGQAVDAVTVSCVAGRGPGAVVGCADARVDEDRVKVKVSWRRDPLTFVGGAFGARTVSGESSMVITGSPLDAGRTS